MRSVTAVPFSRLVHSWWTLPEVAARLGMPRREVFRLIKHGPLVGYCSGRRVTVKGSDLLAYLAAERVAA
jgi:excisionase family DNA binding protein